MSNTTKTDGDGIIKFRISRREYSPSKESTFSSNEKSPVYDAIISNNSETHNIQIIIYDKKDRSKRIYRELNKALGES